MLSNLEFDIRPGSGVGMFEIGVSLWDIMDMLRRFQHLFPRVDVDYDPDVSSTTPIILHIRPHLDLLFSGKHQRLRTVCLRILRDPNSPATIRYKDVILSSTDEILHRVNVSRTFGPTYPGDDLRYPGVRFSFDELGRNDNIKNGAIEDRLQEVKKITVTQKELDYDASDALSEVVECPVMDGEIALAVVKVGDGIRLHFHPSQSSPLHIKMGVTTAQDLTVELGPPLRVHHKEDDRMTIHYNKQSEQSNNNTPAYFYNYFQYGLDFLICGTTHIVQKIILHSNIPGTPLFQRYKRCNWEIEGKPEDDEDDTPPRKRFHERFETISHFLSPHEPPPSMLLDRTDEEDRLTLPNASTRLYGYDGIILEVSESSQIVAVTLFSI